MSGGASAGVSPHGPSTTGPHTFPAAQEACKFPPGFVPSPDIHDHIYHIWKMHHRKIKMGAAVTGVVAGGVGLPLVITWWQQRKAGKTLWGDPLPQTPVEAQKQLYVDRIQ